MSVDTLLSKLEKVRRTGKDSWVACCPAHDDRSPSMTIRDADGTILVHCFALCSVDAIVSAVGMELSDLFPPKPTEHRKPMRRPFNAHDVLACVAREAAIVAMAAADLARGRAMSDIDRERVMLAARRLESARELANG